MKPRRIVCAALPLLVFSGALSAELAFVEQVTFYSSAMSGGVLSLANGDRFGESVAVLPDLDGDGVNELAVGAPGWDSDPGSFAFDNGAVWILFPRANGSLKDGVFIAEGFAGYNLDVPNLLSFGSALACPGDLDGDGLPELLVGAAGFDAANSPEGFVDILSLNPDGTVAQARRLDSSDPALAGTFAGGDRFGRALACPGDVDGDGIADLAISGPNRTALVLQGRVWILFMRADGSVRETHVIDEAELSANGKNTFADREIGEALAALGDLDGDGLPELALSDPTAVHNTNGAAGTVYVVSLATDGSVARLVEITDGLGGFGGAVESFDWFGAGLATIGDLDGDGRDELAVGAVHDDDGGFQSGAVWVLFFGEKGRVTSWEKISELEGGLGNVLDNSGDFGRGLALLPDQDGDGSPTLLAAAARSNDGGTDRGTLYRLDFGPTDPAAAFTTVGSTFGVAPHSVDFVDLSAGTGIDGWSWDFGDGTSASEANPTKVYTSPGSFDVTLTVSSPSGTATVTKVAFVCLDTSARATERNGAGGNPLVFHPDNTPVLGGTWCATVDGATAGATGAVILFLYEGALDGVFLVYGELLVDPTSPLVLALPGFLLGGSAPLQVPVPNDLALLGFGASGQVYLSSTRRLTNAIDLVLGDR